MFTCSIIVTLLHGDLMFTESQRGNGWAHSCYEWCPISACGHVLDLHYSNLTWMIWE